MAEYIKQKIQGGKKSICDSCTHRNVCKAIDNQPCTECNHYQCTADVEPVRHGKWLHTDYALHWTAKDECSECTYHALDRDDLSHYNYCPNCGARMDEENIHE